MFPRINDGAMPKALASRGDWIVYAQDAARQATGDLRKWAEENGLLGRRLYVEQRETLELPLADGLADLLVVSDLGKGDLATERLAAWLRVLVPGRGVAVLGNPREFDRAAVLRWIGKTAESRIVTEGGTTWVVLKRPALPGADEWPQKFHAADNNRLSRDRTLNPPFFPQWYGLPISEGFWGTTVVAANGRYFTLCLKRDPKQPVGLVARSLGNGMLLWRRDYSYALDGSKVGYNPYLVADGDALLLIEYDRVLRLDGETGKELGAIAGPRQGKQIKWMCVADGFLAILAGEDEQFEFKVKAPASQPVMKAPRGRWLSVCRLADGAEQWSRQESGEIDERVIAVRSGRLYYHVSRVGTFCRRLSSGEQVWANTNPETVAAIDAGRDKIKDYDLSLKGMQIAHPSLLAQDEALIISALWYDNVVALDPDSGDLLWKMPHTRLIAGRCVPQVAMQGKWYSANGAFDMRTGKQLAKWKLQQFGCGPSTALSNYFIGCFGDVCEVGSGKLLRPSDDKGPCDVGSIVAGRVIFCTASACGCTVPVKGSRAFTSVPDWSRQMAQQKITRCQTAAPGPAAASFTVDNKDWPTCRHDNSRTGATAVGVSRTGAHRLLWRWKAPAVATAGSLLGTWAPSAPVAAGGKAWLAGADGVIRQFDAASGDLQWEYPTGGKIFVPPVAANGRLYAGTGNGDVLCLDGKGKLRWRFRAAPIDRRIVWYGHLLGTWPLVGGVTVQDGVVYAIAGYQNLYGTHAYALDAADGSVKWETHDAGNGPGSWGGEGSYGSTAILGNRLCWCGGSAQPASFRLQDGARSVLPCEPGSTRFGSEVMVLDPKWLLYGGQRLSTLHGGPGGFGEDGLTVSPTLPLAKPADAKQRLCAGVNLAGNSPVADDALVVMKQRNGLVFACDRKKLLAEIAACYTNDPAPLPPWQQLYTKRLAASAASSDDNPSTGAVHPWSARLWGPMKFGPQGFVLAGDAVVAINGDRIVALDRSSGVELWNVPLRGAALPGGLCIDRDGHILVAQTDGSFACCGLQE